MQLIVIKNNYSKGKIKYLKLIIWNDILYIFIILINEIYNVLKWQIYNSIIIQKLLYNLYNVVILINLIYFYIIYS
jgi:hypothetical protein